MNDLLIKENINLDIVIKNAAFNPIFEKNKQLESCSRLENYSLEKGDLEISVVLTGIFLYCQVLGSAMANSFRGGCILNIASDLSLIAPDQRLYKKKD